VPQKDSTYDIIIAGCGCSGLSLAWNLYKLTGDRFSILMVDKSFSKREKKTWCFWDEDLLPEPVKVTTGWNRLHFGSELLQKNDELRQFQYKCLTSYSYDDEMMEVLRKVENIDWVETDIKNIIENNSSAIVETGKGNFRGGKIFQSVFRTENLNSEGELRQHFIGWEVNADKDIFDEEAATLMDFRVDQKGATAFMYLLPFGSQRALVEYTLFSNQLLEKSEYETEIKSYLKEKFSLEDGEYKIRGKEKGSIPMVENHYQFKSGNYVYNIGMVSGCTKPTTGYTFSRIHRMSRRIAEQLSKNEEPDVKEISPGRFRFYDMLLLDILNENPGASIKIFSELFEKNSMDSILKFLDEKSGVWEDVRLLLSLPWHPFLRALWRSRSKLLKGTF